LLKCSNYGLSETNVQIIEYHSRRNTTRRIFDSIRNYAINLTKELHISAERIAENVQGNRRITVDTALRLSPYFGNSAEFWLGIQDNFDIENKNSLKTKEFSLIKKMTIEKTNS
jgi:addiction module HigA family antidote